MPHRLPIVLTRPLFVIGSCLFVLYWIIAPMFPVRAVLETVSAMLFSMAVAVAFAYAPTAYRRLADSRPGRTAGTLLSLGIFLRWFVDIVWRGMGLLWLLGGAPDFMVHNYLIASFILLATCAGVLHLASVRAIDGEVPSLEWVKVGCLAGGACFTGLLIAALHPTMEWVNALDPWIPQHPWSWSPFR